MDLKTKNHLEFVEICCIAYCNDECKFKKEFPECPCWKPEKPEKPEKSLELK